ncbi:MAG: thymidine phosphorylase [Bacilli bacterium]|nr:thymidine phosphorylase [Bacilli bacterium]MCI6932558.1 thymidine phosphorylase [Mycoplasmatota bacterium]
MNMLDIITKKKNKEVLTHEELYYAFNGYLNKEIPDYQMTSLLMAIVINGLTFEETFDLTKIFIDSGETFKFDKKVCDKHSTGGIGDTVTLVAIPILGTLNIPVVKMSGRGLGITGGTIDKLESIPGFNVNLTKEDYYNNLEKIGIVVGTQTNDLVPLDKVIYALRDVSGTTESIPLIASSIMSKKIACGADYILIDVKWGSGALVKTKKNAEVLSNYLIEIGKRFNRQVKTIISDMNEPLSTCIGNALEVEEAINVLKGEKNKLRETSLEVAGNLASMYLNISYEEAYNRASEVLDNNKAYEMFKTWISNQGGDLSKLKISDKVILIKSNQDGIISHINALKVGELSVKLGAGRITKDSKIDYSVGIKLLKQSGDLVKKGDILAKLYVNDLNIKLTKDDINFYSVK